jgi:hypothetical protein
MKKALLGAWLAVSLVATAWGADESFSSSVPRGDFSAAGLGKLTPEELARLDALVRDYKSGALEAARREAVKAAEARAKAESVARIEAETRAARAEAQVRASETEKKPETSLLARAKVLLTPGTHIEYSTVESRLVGDFRAGRNGRFSSSRMASAGSRGNVELRHAADSRTQGEDRARGVGIVLDVDRGRESTGEGEDCGGEVG